MVENVCNSNQKWNNNKCRCDCKNPKNHCVCGKDYIWNHATCSCENGKYLKTIIDDSSNIWDYLGQFGSKFPNF